MLAATDTIASLPQSLTTLRNRTRRKMPLQRIRTYPVNVDLKTLPPKSTLPANAYRFEVLQYCQLWLANPVIRKSMHFGLGIVNKN